MIANSIPLLISADSSQLALDLDLPLDGDNIFQRLIRNPHIESDTPRERECTEMLCAVLRNTEHLRLLLLKWLAQKASANVEGLDALDYRIDTEGAIGAKRDDLRIEGWKVIAEQETLIVLWTIEVKVGAWFHESTVEESVAPDSLDRQLEVNQLLNYDFWLERQVASCRAGFVLALDDMTIDMPAGLVMPWTCLTWTELAEQIIGFISSGTLPSHELFLAKHFVGFVRRHLWRIRDMGSARIEFDDLALIRAFATIGVECDKKIARLVKPLEAMLDQAGIGEGKCGYQSTLFRSYLRSTVYRTLFRPEVSPYPGLAAGIEKDHLVVFLETSISHPTKALVSQAAKSVIACLQERQTAWRIAAPEDKGWRDLEIALPLVNLLVAPDQEAVFLEFFRRAFDDLKACRVVEAIRERLGVPT